MSKQLAEIFNECIERLQQGDSIEHCLMNYPEVAAELEVLLRTAVNVHWRGSLVQPRPDFKARARAQFIGVQYAAAQERQPSHRPTIFSLQRAWVPAVAAVLVLILSSVGTAAAASDAMPDQLLYPVKLATEQVQLTLAFSDEAKAELNVKLAETRSQEIATMATQGKSEQVTITTERLAQHLEAAERAIIKVEETKTRQITPAPAVTTVPPQPSVTTTPPTRTPPPPTTTAPATPPAPTTPPAATTPAPTPAPEKAKDATGQAEVKTSPPAEKSTVAEVEKLRETLKTSISKNVTALENARDRSPEKTKAALQKAIDLAKSRQLQLQQKSTSPTIKPGTIPTQQKPVQQEQRSPQTPDTSGTTKGQEPSSQTNTGTGNKVTPVPVTPSPTPTPTTPVTPKGTSDSGSSTGDTSKPTSSLSTSTAATTQTTNTITTTTTAADR